MVPPGYRVAVAIIMVAKADDCRDVVRPEFVRCRFQSAAPSGFSGGKALAPPIWTFRA